MEGCSGGRSVREALELECSESEEDGPSSSSDIECGKEGDLRRRGRRVGGRRSGESTVEVVIAGWRKEAVVGDGVVPSSIG